MNHKEYAEANRKAWNEAQTKKPDGSLKKTIARLRDGNGCLDPDLVKAFDSIPLKGKTIGQFCCNNGRDLLSLCKRQPKECIGFDISENFINEASQMAKELGYKCRFVRTDIFDIDGYRDYFDVLLITLGTLNWFQDIDKFFDKAYQVLKTNGWLIIIEGHPFIDMLALPGEKEYQPDEPMKLTYPYFRKQPWINENGMSYVAGVPYKSTAFCDWSHPLSETISAIVKNRMNITSFTEYDHDRGVIGSNVLDGKGFPLSYLLTAVKKP